LPGLSGLRDRTVVRSAGWLLSANHVRHGLGRDFVFWLVVRPLAKMRLAYNDDVAHNVGVV